MNRREWLKNAGLGSLMLPPLVALLHRQVRPAWANHGRTQFIFTGGLSSQSGTDVILLSGEGAFNKFQVVGDGSFTHFQPDTVPPFPVLGSGTWKAKRLLGFDLEGTYGAHAAGVLDMEANLIPEGGGKIPVEIRVICNIGAAGLQTGLVEGTILTFQDGTAFGPGGLTIFSTGVEQRD